MSYYHTMNSSFADRAHQMGNVQLVNVSAEQSVRYNDPTQPFNPANFATEVTYTFQIYGIFANGCIDEFEDRFLENDEFERMKRLINDNPELKDLYEKYEVLDRLEGNNG